MRTAVATAAVAADLGGGADGGVAGGNLPIDEVSPASRVRR
jgi:hypothetical protein